VYFSKKGSQLDLLLLHREALKPLAHGLREFSMSNKWSNVLITLTVASEPWNCGSLSVSLQQSITQKFYYKMKKMVGLLQEWATPGMNRSHKFVIFKN
jgi:hypothetical protein